MKTDQVKRKYLSEYQPPEFTITETHLDFRLGQFTSIHSELKVKRQTDDKQAALKLDGVDLELIQIVIDHQPLSSKQYQYKDGILTIPDVPDEFIFSCEVTINPAANTTMEGLYQSNGNFCTQCEAEGFRYITFYIDRPDVMSVFTTSISADKITIPVMLSNGNKIEYEDLGDKHRVKWFDPFPKPSYLFALVAGNLACIEGDFTTRSGREVALEFYTEFHNKDKCDHALKSLQNAMTWDEQRFGLEYDLDLYMVVAVDDFNMGAMENKGLNVFNTKYVLANAQTATDMDYINIEGVIGHEYFHNWTGNRVTCRDWFQLSLKEGLTVFRDQEFSSDMMSRPIQRINDVRVLRNHQFAEDAGPMAHPIRPASYETINNFYTVTVYNKGAEVIRMMHTLLGEAGFRKGIDLYFERFDGQAVTTDDFRQAMQDASGIDLGQFQRWYEQASTPKVRLTRHYDAENKILTLTVKQLAGETKNQANLPFHIPMTFALFKNNGEEISLDDHNCFEKVIDIKNNSQDFHFDNIDSMPIISAFRGFSAPVKIENDLSAQELAALMSFDSDAFNCWDAGQQLAEAVMLDMINDESEITHNKSVQHLLSAYLNILNNDEIDKSLLAEMLILPGERYLAESVSVVDIHRIHQVREFIKKQLAITQEERLLQLYQHCQQQGEYQITPQAIGQRSLKNICLSYLLMLNKAEYFQLAKDQYDNANNMTDQISCLQSILHYNCIEKELIKDDFFTKWQDTALVIDKWFSALASSQAENALEDILALFDHPSYNIKNPNRARSLLGALSSNSVVFHDESGRAYAFLADKIIEIDILNPQLAARLAGVFLHWKRLVPSLKKLMKSQIERIISTENLSEDVSELMRSALST